MTFRASLGILSSTQCSTNPLNLPLFLLNADSCYRTFSVSFKLTVIDYAQRHSILASARQFRLDRKIARSFVRKDERFMRIRISRERWPVETPENRSGAGLDRSMPVQSCMCTPFLQPGFDRDTLLNGDETTIFIDPTAATFALIGSRRVEVITSGQQKTRQEFRCAIRNWPKVKTSHFVAEKKPLKNWVPQNTTQRSKTFASASIGVKWISVQRVWYHFCS